MSSGFVSAGQSDLVTTTSATATKSSEESPPPPPSPPAEINVVDSWAAADAKKAQAGIPDDGRSLFEVLQANKARKQEEIEEKLKFKNQFRTLDDDEIDFLDSIVSTERAAELERRKEIESQLDTFRKQQYEADHDPSNTLSSTNIDPIIEDAIPTWAVSGRKKRRKKDRAMSNGGGSGGAGTLVSSSSSSSAKLRKLSDGTRQKRGESDVVGVDKTVTDVKKVPGLTSYDDDDDDDEDDDNDDDDVVRVQNKVEKVGSDDTSKGLKANVPLVKAAPVTAIVKQTSGLGGLVSGYESDSD